MKNSNPLWSPEVQVAFQRLMDGNKRFTNGLRSVEAMHTTQKLKDLAENGQSPFGIILTCSDSRVPTEMVFDQGLGDLFVVRVAGNIASASQIASIEFAALNFKSPVCIVMGHSQCGAVKAALSVEKNEKIGLTPNLEKLVARVRPAVRTALRNTDCADMLSECTWENVRRTVRLIRKRSAAIRQLEESKQFRLIGAVYDLHTGQVQIDESTFNADDQDTTSTQSGAYEVVSTRV
jgi:carbonic anhydrase